RRILLSSAYQMGGGNAAAEGRDPENRLWSRFPRRRLEAEEIRDALLAVSGSLDRTMGGSMLHVANREFFFDHTSKDGTKYATARRSLYLPRVRNHLADVFQIFDAPDSATVHGDRASTIVPLQSLYLMNSETALKAADDLAAKAIRSAPDDERRLDFVFRRALGRPASSAERVQTLTWLAKVKAAQPAGDSQRLAWACAAQVLFAGNEFLYLD
ncbi:MAG TPA: DUF1553 domain-containing protein, partial [Planctomycetia bacterium]|nr:DUF1553 domain-containing protein [Planctomycetia bacterium]